MKCVTFCLLAVLVVSIGCRNDRDGLIVLSKGQLINLDSGVKTYSFASAINCKEIINLQTNDQSVISAPLGISKIIMKEGKFYILDRKFNSIKVFDTAGKYLYNLGSPGLVRGEFLNVQDMVYYRPHNSVLVLCNTPSKIVEFSLEGEVLDDRRLSFFASSIAIQANDTRLFYVNQNQNEVSGTKNILLTDNRNEVISRLFDFPKKLRASIAFTGGIYSTGGEIFFNPPFSNFYYKLSGDTATPAFEVNYGKRNIPTELSEAGIMPNPKKYNYQSNTFFKNTDYIGFNYVDKRMSVACYNVRSGNIITNDIKSDSLNILFYNSVYECDNKLIMVLDPNGMSGFFKRNSAIIRQKLPYLFDHLVFAKHQNPSLMIFSINNL